MVSATLSSMLKTRSPARSSENSTVVEDDEFGDGGVAGGRFIMRPLALVVVDLFAFPPKASVGSPLYSPACSGQAYQPDHQRTQLQRRLWVEDDEVGGGGRGAIE